MRITGKKISVIASDFDGTIIKHGMMAPTERFYELINQCLEQGIFFVAASGRQYINLNKLLKRLNKEIAYIVNSTKTKANKILDDLFLLFNTAAVSELALFLLKIFIFTLLTINTQRQELNQIVFAPLK